MTFQLHNSPAAKAVIALTIAAAAASCIKEVPADAIVAVGNATLTLSDLRKAIPAGLSATDSATFAESYINSWISDMLITEIAEKNIPDTPFHPVVAEIFIQDVIVFYICFFKQFDVSVLV